MITDSPKIEFSMFAEEQLREFVTKAYMMGYRDGFEDASPQKDVMMMSTTTSESEEVTEPTQDPLPLEWS